MIHPHVEETVSALHRAIASAGVGADQLTAVLLVGGSSRIPLVAQMVSEQLGRPVAVDADPKNAIAKGAALSLTPAGISATGAYAPAPRGHGSGPVAPHGAAGAPAGHRVEPVVARAAAARPGRTPPRPTEAFAPTQRMSSSRPSGPTAPPVRPPLPELRVRRRRVLLRPATTATAQPGRARRRGGCGGRRGRARDGVPVAAARGVDGEPRHGADRRRHHHRRRPHHRGRPHHHAWRRSCRSRRSVRRTVVVPPPVTTTVAPLPTTTEPPPTTTSKPANQLGPAHHHDVIDEPPPADPNAPNVAPFRVGA